MQLVGIQHGVAAHAVSLHTAVEEVELSLGSGLSHPLAAAAATCTDKLKFHKSSFLVASSPTRVTPGYRIHTKMIGDGNWSRGI